MRVIYTPFYGIIVWINACSCIFIRERESERERLEHIRSKNRYSTSTTDEAGSNRGKTRTETQTHIKIKLLIQILVPAGASPNCLTKRTGMTGKSFQECWQSRLRGMVSWAGNARIAGSYQTQRQTRKQSLSVKDIGLDEAYRAMSSAWNASEPNRLERYTITRLIHESMVTLRDAEIMTRNVS